jgi:hypothetical protein
MTENVVVERVAERLDAEWCRLVDLAAVAARERCLRVPLSDTPFFRPVRRRCLQA